MKKKIQKISNDPTDFLGWLRHWPADSEREHGREQGVVVCERPTLMAQPASGNGGTGKVIPVLMVLRTTVRSQAYILGALVKLHSTKKVECKVAMPAGASVAWRRPASSSSVTKSPVSPRPPLRLQHLASTGSTSPTIASPLSTPIFSG